MTKTFWEITDKNINITTVLCYYHFGKEPKFPTWYMEENHDYNIKPIKVVKINSFKNFFRCLFHEYILH
jgi:hypothetical protein